MDKDSMWTGLRLSQVRLIASYWVRFSLRTGGGLVAMLLVLMVGMSVAGIFIAPVEQMMQASPDLGHTPREGADTIRQLTESDQFVDVVRWVTGTERDQASYLLQDNPGLLSVIFIVLMWLYPFIACIGAFNQTAGDIGNQGLRYLLIRTERPNILVGRFVGTMAASKLALAFMFAVLLLYVGFKISLWPWGEVLWWGFQGFVALVFLILPYVAMCAWVSSFMSSSFGSLALCLVFAGVPILFINIAQASAATLDLDWLDLVIPWGWKYDLLSGDLQTRLIAYGVMLGFALVFFLLALRSFHKRDL